MVNCRSLIEFCRAFEHQRNMPQSNSSRKVTRSLNPFSHPLCEHSPFAAIDIVILLLALLALGVLTFPYFKLILREFLEILPPTLELIGEVILNAPVAYVAGLVLVFVSAVAAWEILDHKSRKCGKPGCKGLRRAVEFDIQLESEECVKCLPSGSKEGFGVRPLGLGQDHKELEAELKKMAPPNGRTVLIFRAPCGCPAGRMEVWGHKKVRRIKK